MKRNEIRQFARVKTLDQKDSLKSIANVFIKWSSNSQLKVFDISYGGLACEKPTQDHLELGAFKNLEIVFPGENPQNVVAQVVWMGGSMMGLQFSPLSTEARKAINKFLDPRLLGVDLRPIDKKFFSKELDCDYWYQGEYGTNVYVWLKATKVVKCEVELEEFSVRFEKGQVFLSEIENSRGSHNGKDKTNFALQILQPLAMQNSEILDFVKLVRMELKSNF